MVRPGERLGPYEILAAIGKGGMGEVYRARDTRLGRDVAVKVSAEKFGERFEREARAVAALNHPNICTLHDVGPDYLVMELVEGPTLAERIREGAMPYEESLHLARQIAEALEAAHEQGITHRDLKPGNIKVKPDGAVKVLDFGLAKMGGTPAAQGDDSPTLTVGQTQAGMILGTAAYMSPEQAKGKPVDHRADIYSFGVVLYEMVTGSRLHDGEAITEVLASVIKEEPSWERVPAELRRLLRRCLEKDPRKRLRHIGDVMALVDEAPSFAIAPAGGPAAAMAGKAARVWKAVAAGLALTTLALAAWALWPRDVPRAAITRFQVAAPAGNRFGIYMVLSPDGRRLAFTAVGADGRTTIWVRDMESENSRQLPGTEIGSGFGSPFWSPDSRMIGFADGNRLKKVDAGGTTSPQTIAEVGFPVGTGNWGTAGVILFGGRGAGPISRVSETGGTATPVTVIDSSRGELFHGFPFFLPDGRHFLHMRVGNAESQGIYIGSLDATPEEQPRERLFPTDYGAVFAPAANGGGGRILFLRDGTLLAQAFDAASLELAGDAIPIAENVGSTNAFGNFSAARSGTLAFRRGSGQGGTQPTWLSEGGARTGTVGEPGAYGVRPFLSPDGTRVALDRVDGGNRDVWVIEFARGVTTRFTFERFDESFPLWSRDASTIVFRSNREGPYNLYRRPSNGAGDEELLVRSDYDKWANDWSPDGRYLIYEELAPNGPEDLWLLPMSGDRKPVPWLQSSFAEWEAHFSPDGRWVAYQSNETGRFEIYVRPFEGAVGAPAGGKWQVSRDGGARPRWRRDGRVLYFQGPDGAVMAVDVNGGAAFSSGPPRQLFTLPTNVNWDVSRDGQRFLALLPAQEEAAAPITVVLNWEADLKKE